MRQTTQNGKTFYDFTDENTVKQDLEVIKGLIEENTGQLIIMNDLLSRRAA